LPTFSAEVSLRRKSASGALRLEAVAAMFAGERERTNVNSGADAVPGNGGVAEQGGVAQA